MMRAARFYGPGDARIEDVALPTPGPGEIVIEIRAATTCGTDLKAYRRGHPVLFRELPASFGHEGSGVVSAIGEGVTAFAVGDRVVAANSAPCGECYDCRKGRESLCGDLLLLNGTYAEYLLVPARIVARNCYSLSAHVSFAAASLTEPLACALHGVAVADPQPGDTVVIIGGGPLGLLLLAVARQRGARVILAGRGLERLAMARRWGAEVIDAASFADLEGEIAAIRASTEDGRGADIVIEAVGQPELWEASARMARRGGTVILFGGCASGTSVTYPTRPLHYDELTLRGVFHHTPSIFAQALGLISAWAIPVTDLLSGTVPLDDLIATFERLARGEGIKYLVEP